MNPIELLLNRKSHNKLVAPAPNELQVEKMLSAALRAPDHAQLRPWRYRIYQDNALVDLGEKFLAASLLRMPELSIEKQNRIKAKPLRAPMVIVASVVIKEHPKVPKVEQLLSAGASVQNLIMAAHFQDVGAIWRTGELTFNRDLMDMLGLDKNEEIVAFIYLGKEEGLKKQVPQINQNDFVKWM